MTTHKTAGRSLKLSINSHVNLNLIDTIHIDLHPSFIRPDGPFMIQAIGQENVGRANQPDKFNVYAENNGNLYVLEIHAIEDSVESVAIFQNVLTLNPADEEEWGTLLDDIAGKDLELDGVTYQRTLGGDVEKAELFEFNERIKTRDNDEYDCFNKLMLFERTINPWHFTEQLKTVVEVIQSREQAGVSFYIGFALHPSTLTLM